MKALGFKPLKKLVEKENVCYHFHIGFPVFLIQRFFGTYELYGQLTQTSCSLAILKHVVQLR